MSNAATVNLHASGVQKRIRAWLVEREKRIQQQKNDLVSAVASANVPDGFGQSILHLCRRPYRAKTVEQIEQSLTQEFWHIEMTGGMWANHAKQLEAAAQVAISSGDRFICVPIDWVLVFGLHHD